MAHGTEVMPYRALVHTMLRCQLYKGLLAIYVVTGKLLIINTGTTNELTTARLAFITLFASTKVVFYNKTATTIKVFFCQIQLNKTNIL